MALWTKSVDNEALHSENQHSFFTMLAPQLVPSALTNSVPVILQFPTEASRPETTPRMSLTDIALKEIIAGKLAYEALEGSSDGA